MLVKSLMSIFAVALVGCVGISAPQRAPAAASVPQAAPAQQASAPDPALKVIDDHCTACHGTYQIFEQRKSAKDWAETVQTMIDRGSDVTPEQQAQITAYLTKTYPAK